MAQKTDAELQIERAVIENETTAGANTAVRIGDMLENIIDSKVNNDTTSQFRGSWATGNAFPTTGGSGGGAPVAGDMWNITVDLSVGGNFYPSGTVIMALIDTPGQTLTNWAKFSMQL